MAIIGSHYLVKLVTPVVELIQQESAEIEVVPEKVVRRTVLLIASCINLQILGIEERTRKKSRALTLPFGCVSQFGVPLSSDTSGHSQGALCCSECNTEILS